MILKIIALVALLAVLCPAQLKFQDEDESERTKYGMSQAEWQQYKESGLTISQLEHLLECGIAMSEYSSRPWLSLGISEKDWIAERCKGMVDEDIQAFHEREENDYSVILAFALPGSHHWRTHSYGTAAALSSAFILSVSLYFALPEVTEEPRMATVDEPNATGTREVRTPRPAFLVVALADMVLSSVLAYRDFNKAKNNSDVKSDSKTSFHLDISNTRPMLNCTYRF